MIRSVILVSMVAAVVLAVGTAAPDFEAISQDGRKVILSELRQQGPVMLVFLRGFS